MLPQVIVIIILAFSALFLVGAFIATRFGTFDIGQVLFLVLAGGLAYVVWDSGLFPNWWVGLLISATLTCMAVVFIWGLNRFSYRSFLVRAYAGGILSIFSWISAAGIAIRKYMGWGVSVPLISEITSGIDWEDDPEIRQRVRRLQIDAEAGGEGEAAVDTQQSWIRSAIAAIPDQGDREEATKLLQQNLTGDVMRLLEQLGLAGPNARRVRRRAPQGQGMGQPPLLPQEEKAQAPPPQ
jgi:hypothetical protein